MSRREGRFLPNESPGPIVSMDELECHPEEHAEYHGRVVQVRECACLHHHLLACL